MPADDPLTPAELAFRALLEQPSALAEWCEAARTRWEREHGVEWLHHRNGAQVWLPKRPRLDPDRSASFRFNPERAAAYAAAKASASSASIGDTPRSGTHPRKQG